MADAKDDEVSVVELVTQGYAFAGAALEVGALVVDGTATAPEAKVRIPLAMVNRHGLVAGATGTGKTKTLQLMAEQLSAHGVPVFLADIKGDLSGMATAGEPSDRTATRASDVGQAWAGTSYPVEFYALGGQGTGIPIRVSITSFGPSCCRRCSGSTRPRSPASAWSSTTPTRPVWPLLDLKDLRAVVSHLTSDEGKADLEGLGGLSKATAGVILRELIGF